MMIVGANLVIGCPMRLDLRLNNNHNNDNYMSAIFVTLYNLDENYIVKGVPDMPVQTVSYLQRAQNHIILCLSKNE